MYAVHNYYTYMYHNSSNSFSITLAAYIGAQVTCLMGIMLFQHSVKECVCTATFPLYRGESKVLIYTHQVISFHSLPQPLTSRLHLLVVQEQ